MSLRHWTTDKVIKFSCEYRQYSQITTTTTIKRSRNLAGRKLDLCKLFLLLITLKSYVSGQVDNLDEQDSFRRPVWNIAHMVNSIKEVDYRLSKGANSLEADVTFDINGTPLTTFHGPPCDCWRHCNQQDNFSDYLKYISELIKPDNDKVYGRNLSLLFLDLKLDKLRFPAKVNAGIQLAKLIATNLYNINNITTVGHQNNQESITNQERQQRLADDKLIRQRPIYLVISINHVNDMDLVLNFVHFMNQNKLDNLLNKYIGWDVGMNDDIELIEAAWRRFGHQLNLWQGDGFTNCISPFYNLRRLTSALTRRNSESGYMSKVYQWTIDLHDRIRDALRLNVDGIMTNHPERLITILEEPEFSNRFRLASILDNPFQKLHKLYSRRTGDAARYNQAPLVSSAPVVVGGLMGILGDIVTSWAIYVRDIPFLGMPAATRWIPKRRRQKQHDDHHDVSGSYKPTTVGPSYSRPAISNRIDDNDDNLFYPPPSLPNEQQEQEEEDSGGIIDVLTVIRSILLFFFSPSSSSNGLVDHPTRNDLTSYETTATNKTNIVKNDLSFVDRFSKTLNGI